MAAESEKTKVTNKQQNKYTFNKPPPLNNKLFGDKNKKI